MASTDRLIHRAKHSAGRLVGEPGRAVYRRLRDGSPRTIRRSVPAPAAPAGGYTEHASWRTFWPAPPPPGYCGQLDDEFQRALAESRAAVTVDDCDFYHSVSLPDGTETPGAWDLRGGERAYLGAIELSGARVLELGPATGGLTFWMERSGAEVVAFDAGYDVAIDLLPFNGADLTAVRGDHMRELERVQNSWWYLHRELESRARIAYGDIYALPGDLGIFDVAVFGAILVHLRDPFSALQQGAARTRSTIVVTDAIDHTISRSRSPERDVLRFNPTGRLDRWVSWWTMTPAAVVSMLNVLGFVDTTTTFHRQRHHELHDRSVAAIEREMFTVVGRRSEESARFWTPPEAPAGQR